MDFNEMEVVTPTFTEENNTRDFYQGIDYGLIEKVNNQSTENGISRFMPVWVQVAWSAIFILMILIAAAGNCIVIWIVLAHRRMRTITNYFLVNLSVADLLLTTLNCMFNFIYMIQRNWPFGNWYCAISNFIANSTVAASVFTLTGISCDRYLAIVHPLQPRMTRTCSIVAIIFIWTTSMLIAAPCLLYSTTITNSYRGVERTGCILIWPDQKSVGSIYDLWYQIAFLLITYIIPIILMSVCYFIMSRVLWGSQSIGEKTERQIGAIKSKRKVVKMFIFIVAIFSLCWLPYHAYFIYVNFDTSVIFSKYTQHIYLGFYWFAMSNAMINPLIYYFMNARFRQYFQSAACGWRKCLKKNDDGDGKALKVTYSRSLTRMDGTMKAKHPNRQDNSGPKPVQTCTDRISSVRSKKWPSFSKPQAEQKTTV